MVQSVLGEELGMQMREIEASLRAAQEKKEALRASLDEEERTPKTMKSKRIENFQKRKNEYEARIKALESAIIESREKIRSRKENTQKEPNTDPLNCLQKMVLDKVDLYQDRTTSLLDERNRELNRALRARLTDSSRETEEIRKRNGAGAQKWKDRAELLNSERKWANNLCNSLKAENETLLKANAELQAKLKEGSQDRQHLVSLLAKVKKDNGRCCLLIEKIDRRLAEQPNKHPSDDLDNGPRTGDQHSSSRGPLSPAKSLDEIKHLERLLDSQQKALVTLRLNCVEEAEESVALQNLVRNRLSDLHSKLGQLKAPKSQNQTQIAQLTWEVRFLTLLYQRAFPPLSTNKQHKSRTKEAHTLKSIEQPRSPPQDKLLTSSTNEPPPNERRRDEDLGSKLPAVGGGGGGKNNSPLSQKK